MKSLLTWTERRLVRLFRKLSNRQNFYLKAEMFSFHSKYFVYRELKRAPQKFSFCFKCPDTGTVRILGNILYRIILGMGKGTMKWLPHRIDLKQHYPRDITPLRTTTTTLYSLYSGTSLIRSLMGQKKLAVLPGQAQIFFVIEGP